jgi:hypothetical protein
MYDTMPFNLPQQAHTELNTALNNARGSDNTFINALVDAYRWELYTLGQIQMYGHWGTIHPLHTRPDRVEASNYSDPYDIVIGSQPGIPIQQSWQLHLDVKARSYPFTEPDTWPFPTVTVDPVSRFKRRNVKPDWWVIVSSCNGSVMFIDAKSLLAGGEEYLPGHSIYKSAPRESFISLRAFVERLPAATVTLDNRARHPKI